MSDVDEDYQETLKILTQENMYLKNREKYLLNKIDIYKRKLQVIYKKPLLFAIARLYHRYLLRDEANV